ncbi:MAG TPA: hypothetical protein PKC52_05950 [Anaerolineales bacterium]|nr:hypothetical protein [Anaerolineales bacterium]
MEQTLYSLRLLSMRPLYIFLLSSVFVFVAGCSTPQTTVNNVPVSEPTSNDLPPSSVAFVDARFAAEATAIQLLETLDGANWLEGPRVLYVEEMSYEEANQKIGLGEGDFVTWPQGTRVWFVIASGRWQVTQFGPNPEIYEGCLFMVYSVSGANIIAMGDSVCPTN